MVNEAETRLIEDLVCSLTKIVSDNIGYQHDKIDSNAHAHLRAIIVGNSAVIPIENKKLILGSWQRLLFLEFDGPRRRRIAVKLISD
ncbi:MAG: secondary thiamine-phosphate synthase enzyme YjbQ [Methanotrichaceae archaeon]|nr:secondary thiamine-phosphate synthase enzyme YjbQ [Methanotrichaceae archaeon]